MLEATFPELTHWPLRTPTAPDAPSTPLPARKIGRPRSLDTACRMVPAQEAMREKRRLKVEAYRRVLQDAREMGTGAYFLSADGIARVAGTL